MNDLIRRRQAICAISNYHKLKLDKGVTSVLKENKELCNKIREIPAADAIPVIHGEWIYDNPTCLPKCSICGKRSHSAAWAGEDNFCGHCGAKNGVMGITLEKLKNTNLEAKKDCAFCKEPSKFAIGYYDGENGSGKVYACKKTECTSNKNVLQTGKKKLSDEIKTLVRQRIRAGLTMYDAATFVGVNSAEYSAWEHEKKPIPKEIYDKLIHYFEAEQKKQRCGNCCYYDGESEDREAFCNRKEEYVSEDYRCAGYIRRRM